MLERHHNGDEVVILYNGVEVGRHSARHEEWVQLEIKEGKKEERLKGVAQLIAGVLVFAACTYWGNPLTWLSTKVLLAIAGWVK